MPHTLWSDGAGFVLSATLSAGGAGGKALFFTSLQLAKTGASPASSLALLRRAGTQWQLAGALVLGAVAVVGGALGELRAPACSVARARGRRCLGSR